MTNLTSSRETALSQETMAVQPAGQSQVLSLPVLSVKDVETVGSNEKLWMPNDAVFQQRNYSASMHHSRGYYTDCKRPVHLLQTVGKKQRCSTVLFQTPQGTRIHPKRRDHLVRAAVHKGSPNGTQDRSARQISKLSGPQQQPFLPLCANSQEARLVSRARIFFSENASETREGGMPIENSKLPKLACSQESNLQQEGRSYYLHLPAISNQDSECLKSSDSTPECTPEVDACTSRSGTAINNSYSKLGLKSPKKWEEEYLHKTPKSFIFSRQHMLFSMESVNKRLLENGIKHVKKPVKKERTWLHPSRKVRRMEGTHRSSLDSGEAEAPFGIAEKRDAISRCFMKSMERQKSKRPSKVITGRSLCSNIPPTSHTIKFTLTATGKSYKDSTAQAGRETCSDDELTYE